MHYWGWEWRNSSKKWTKKNISIIYLKIYYIIIASNKCHNVVMTSLLELKYIKCSQIICLKIKIITMSNQSLPNTVSAVRTTTYNHLTIHVKLHRLHPRFLLVPSQNQLLLTCSIVKQVNKSIICSYCKQTTRSIHTYTVSWFLLCAKTISLSTSRKIPSFY